MALTIPNTSAGGRILYTTPTRHTLNRSYNLNFSPSSSQTRTLHVTAASKKTSSRTGRFDSRNRRSSTTTTTEEPERAAEIERQSAEIENFVDDGYVVPDLPGLKPDFWEGEQWEPLGFFIEYMWAFGVVFSLMACGVAAVTYNEGAADFKDTPAYKESVQSQEFIEEPDSSNSDVFESNPTEVAPSLE